MLCACHEAVDVGYNTSNTTTPDASTASTAPTAFGSPRWAIDLGTTYADTGTAIAFTSTGDVVAAGTFGGPNNSVGISTPTGFVTQRAASDGSARWTATMATLADLSYVSIAGVAIDPTDDAVVVTGNYIGSVDFGGQTLSLAEPPEPSYSDTFVARYSSTGQLQWVTGLSSMANVDGVAITTDSAGHAIVTGVFSGTVTFGSAQYSEPSGSDNASFLVAYDAAGNQLWGEGFVSSIGPSATSVTVDANDNVLIAGAFVGAASFGSGMLTSTGPAAFLARFRSDGSYLAAHVVSTDGTYPTQVVGDATGHALVQTVGSEPSLCELYAIDGSDHDLWSATIPDHSGASPQQRALAAMPSGSILSSAWDDYTASHMEVVAFDSTGHSSTSEFGSRLAGQGFSTQARATAASSSGAIAFVGDFTGTIELAGSALTAQMLVGSDVDPDPITDAFVVVVDP